MLISDGLRPLGGEIVNLERSIPLSGLGKIVVIVVELFVLVPGPDLYFQGDHLVP